MPGHRTNAVIEQRIAEARQFARDHARPGDANDHAALFVGALTGFPAAMPRTASPASRMRGERGQP